MYANNIGRGNTNMADLAYRRTDRWANRYVHRGVLLQVQRHGHSHESVQRFVDHVTDLIVELEEVPPERARH